MSGGGADPIKSCRLCWELGFCSASGGKPLEHLTKIWFVFRKIPLAALWSADCTGGGRGRREGGWEATGV